MVEEEPPELVKVTRDLREIEALHATLREQAAARAGDSRMPGGNAMTMLAPVADPEAYTNLIDAADREHFKWCPRVTHAKCRFAEHVDDEDADWESVLQLLLFWSEQWRYEHGNVSDFRPTVGTEAAFLRHILNWAWQHEPRFSDFAADVRKARTTIENELYAGNRMERTRVPCTEDECVHKPRLIRVYGKAVTHDHYKCPRCKTRYNESDFARAKLRLLASQGAARFVKLQDAVAAIERPERTMRQWIHDLRVTAMCDRKTHQIWVYWPHVRERDLEAPRRSRSRAS